MVRQHEHVTTCSVHGCRVRTHLYAVFLNLDEAYFPATLNDGFATDHPGAEGGGLEPLVACARHAAMLGAPITEEDSEATYRCVVIDPAKAEGWRLVVEVRSHGYLAVLYPPGGFAEGEPAGAD